MEPTVTLNVGGTRFTTYVSTLKTFPGSTLCNMIENYNVDQEDIFIDRDPELFRCILICLRNRKVFPATCFSHINHELWSTELDYFMLSQPEKKSLKEVVKIVKDRKRKEFDDNMINIASLFEWMFDHKKTSIKLEDIPWNIFNGLTNEFIANNFSDISKNASTNGICLDIRGNWLSITLRE